MLVSLLVPSLVSRLPIQQMHANIFKCYSALKRLQWNQSIQSCQSHQNIQMLSISMEYKICRLQKCMQQFSFAINAYKSCCHYFKHLNILSRSLYQKNNDYESYITNQANLKTELVLQKTSTAHVEECPGISKFMKLFQMFFFLIC